MEITDAIFLLIDSGFKTVPHRVEGRWKGTGRPDDILEVNHLMLDGIEMHNERAVENRSSISRDGVLGSRPSSFLRAWRLIPTLPPSSAKSA